MMEKTKNGIVVFSTTAIGAPLRKAAIVKTGFLILNQIMGKCVSWVMWPKL